MSTWDVGRGKWYVASGTWNVERVERTCGYVPGVRVAMRRPEKTPKNPDGDTFFDPPPLKKHLVFYLDAAVKNII